MYKISKLKLILIIGVFLFSILYLLPTIPGVYGRLYGYFDVWMQGRIPRPDIQSNKDGEFIRFVIPEASLPKGKSVQEASKDIQDIVERRLANLGIRRTLEIDQPQGMGEGFRFDDVVTTHIYLRFTQMRSKTDLENIVSKLQLGGSPPLISRPPELPTGQYQGSIKFIITKDDIPEGVSMREGIENIESKLKEQLVSQGISDGEFSFNQASGNELHLIFNPPRSKAQLDLLLHDLRLYGGIPLAIRPIFPDSPLKQGLDLKGGMHVVLELDVKKAMDIYLDGQAKEAILSSLKSEKIAAKPIKKTLEKVDDYTFAIRPYPTKDSGVTEAQYIADMRKKLVEMGFSEEDIQNTSSEGPELTVKTSTERDISDLVDTLLGGNNPLIVTIVISSRADRADYIKTAEETLDKLELFDKPRLLQERENQIVYSIQMSEESAKKLAEDNIDTVMETLQNRINKFGLAESTMRRVRGRPRILIEIPEEQNPTRTLAAIKSPGILEFKLVKPDPLSGSGVWYGTSGTPQPPPSELPAGAEVRTHIDGGWYVLDPEVFMHGTDLKSNSATVSRGEYGSPEVIMYLTPEGQRKFSSFTEKHVNEHTAIMLDEVIQSTPRITEKISSRSARITGSFTPEEADYLAKILKAGAFPAPMKSAEERIVGPTLGREAINRGKIAFILGTSLVIIFMVVYYKWSGVIAVAALLFQFQIILGVLSGFGATLTLPGMAGLTLTIGMSVDANVLILERIREELRSGKTIRSAIDTGYHRAFSAILDSNVTTLITSIVLYEFGTGPIKGFAVTLSIGLMANMFTAILVTREIYSWTYYRRRVLNKLSI